MLLVAFGPVFPRLQATMFIALMEQIFLSIGSNLGDRHSNLRQAIASLRRLASVHAISHVYETEPVDYTDQPWFMNAAVALALDAQQFPPGHAPQMLLDRLLAIEREMGRQRASADIPKGPRIIDLDIVLFGSRVIHTASLTVPHPAMHRRRFVLAPLAEIAPHVQHPTLHRSVLELLQSLPDEGSTVRRSASLDLAK